MRVVLHQGVDGLTRIEREWRSIATRSSSYFHDFKWFRACLQHDRLDNQAYAFLQVSDEEGQTLGILPLERRSETIRRVPFAVWSLVGSRQSDVMMATSSTDLLCIDAALAPAILRSAVDHLARMRDAPSLLQLGRIFEDSMAFRACTEWQGLSQRYTHGAASWFDTHRTFDEFESSLSRKFRSNMRNRYSKAVATGSLRLSVVIDDEPELLRVLAEFMQIEASGWKGHSAGGAALAVNPDSSQRDFFLSVLRGSDGYRPMVFRLMLGDQCIAAQLSVRRGAVVAALKIAYDEAFSALAPGHLLMREVFRYCCEDPEIQWVDRVSSADWHASWKPVSRIHHWVYIPLRWPLGPIGIALLKLPSRAAFRRRRASV